MITRISKSTAEDVAKRMATATIGAKIGEVKRQMADMANELLKNKVPADITACSKAYPNYFTIINSAYFKADGLEVICIEGLQGYPRKGNSWCDTFECTRKFYDAIHDLDVRKRQLLEEQKVLIRTVENTLFALRTLKNVKDKFPEAVSYFPKSFFEERNDEISLPLESIKDMLKKYNEPKG